ncbi:MAG TPA: class I SAM-dependent methyltransferase [Thermoplasmata archaeon]|nr:class I SAM-dependent methyltransferase [Thermoplasmata archaeon]
MSDGGVHLAEAGIDPLEELRTIYGPRLGLHRDLYEASNAHRGAHGDGCDAYPSSPAQAPLWPLLAEITRGRRFLEIGCGLGYTAALMASAGGSSCRVDTIQADPVHADLAIKAMARKGFGGRVRVLRGRALEILETLKRPYDVVFLDGDWREYPRYYRHIVRLTRPGSVVVTANISPLMGGWNADLPGRGEIRSYLRRLVRDRRFLTYITRGEWHAYSVRL